MPDSSGPYLGTIAAAAQKYGVDPSVLAGLIATESSFNPRADSGYARGIAQFTPGTAAQYGVDVSSPTSSIFGAAHYLADLQKQLGSDLGIIAYNAGPGNARTIAAGGYVDGADPAYLSKVRRNARDFVGVFGMVDFMGGRTIGAQSFGAAPAPSRANPPHAPVEIGAQVVTGLGITIAIILGLVAIGSAK